MRECRRDARSTMQAGGLRYNPAPGGRGIRHPGSGIRDGRERMLWCGRLGCVSARPAIANFVLRIPPAHPGAWRRVFVAQASRLQSLRIQDRRTKIENPPPNRERGDRFGAGGLFVLCFSFFDRCCRPEACATTPLRVGDGQFAIRNSQFGMVWGRGPRQVDKCRTEPDTNLN